MNDFTTIIGLDIGGTKTAIVEGTRDARILQRVELATEAERPLTRPRWPLPPKPARGWDAARRCSWTRSIRLDAFVVPPSGGSVCS
jgi:hypothetical protein